MIFLLFTIIISIFLAVNMGASGFSVSFTPSIGANILKKNFAVFLYTLFLLSGAILIGNNVVKTLSEKLIKSTYNVNSSFLIIFSATITMFLANVLKIPQSTSFVTVASFTGAGIYFKQLNLIKISEIFLFAIIFSIFSFIIAFLIMKYFYPPAKHNFRVYEKFFANKKFFKGFIILTDCYSSFGIGTNNVANIVAPVLIALTSFNNSLLLLAIFSPLFGLGALILGKKIIKTVSNDIVPIGEISAFIISVITTTFVVIASILGLPAPYVQFTTFAILGVSSAKDGFKETFQKNIVKKIFIVWFFVPIVTALLSYLLHKIILG